MKSFLAAALLLAPLPVAAAVVPIPSESYVSLAQAGVPTRGSIVLTIAADVMPTAPFTVDWVLETVAYEPFPTEVPGTRNWAETVTFEDFTRFEALYVRLFGFDAAELGVERIENGWAEVRQTVVPGPAAIFGLLTALGSLGLLRRRRSPGLA